jgi:hypothetical protein
MELPSILGLPGILGYSPAAPLDPADSLEMESGRPEQTLGAPRWGAG